MDEAGMYPVPQADSRIRYDYKGDRILRVTSFDLQCVLKADTISRYEHY
jgi:hypothetical protein